MELEGVELIEVHDSLADHEDPSAVVVQVQLLYNLYNPEQGDEFDDREGKRVAEEFRRAGAAADDETQFEETNDNEDDDNKEAEEKK